MAPTSSAADTRALQPRSTRGQLLLADTHYGLAQQSVLKPGTGIPGQYIWGPEAWMFGEVPGTPINLDAYGGEEAVAGLNDLGLGILVEKIADGIPPVYEDKMMPGRQQMFSVLRTGTGDLDLLAAADFTMTSPFGVYTAGTAGGPAWMRAYNQARARGADGTLLVRNGRLPRTVHQRRRPEHLPGVVSRARRQRAGARAGRCARRHHRHQAGHHPQRRRAGPDARPLRHLGRGRLAVAPGHRRARRRPARACPPHGGVNFGSYMAAFPDQYAAQGTLPFLVGFTGIGTLGGGNLVMEAGGNAGMLAARMGNGADARRAAKAWVLAGQHGRVSADGSTRTQTGEGDLDIRYRRRPRTRWREVRNQPDNNDAWSRPDPSRIRAST